MRREVKEAIITTVSSEKKPLTISFIKRKVSKKVGRDISWNTTKKYINELISNNKLRAISLPHSKNERKRGLTVYTLKQ